MATGCNASGGSSLIFVAVAVSVVVDGSLAISIVLFLPCRERWTHHRCCARGS
jgi:hypothetical protein